MSDRFPLIIDTTDNKIKELPIGDNLDLEGSGLVNASNIATDALTVNSFSVNNQSLSTVAFSNDYNDLDNTPSGFSGNYQDLTNTPSIPTDIRALNDVSGNIPTDGQALLYNDTIGLYVPSNVLTSVNLEDYNIGELNDVVITGTITNKFLKYTAGAWRPSRVQYAELQDKPTNVSFFANDAGYITADAIQEIQGDFQGSVFADDSTLLVDGVNGTITGSIDTDSVTNSQGNLTISASNYVVIDSTDNGQIEIGRASGVGDVIIGNAANGTDLLIDTNVSVSGNIVPDTADTYDLGSSDKPFRSLYLSDNTLVMGGYSLGIDNGNLKVTPPGEDPGNEAFAVDTLAAQVLAVETNLFLDGFATMNLGSHIEFEQRTEQSGIEIGKLGSFDNFIGFTEFGGMMISTSGVPATSIGQPGTPVGAIAFDSDYIYYCTATFDGVSNIWKRVAWSGDTW